MILNRPVFNFLNSQTQNSITPNVIVPNITYPTNNYTDITTSAMIGALDGISYNNNVFKLTKDIVWFGVNDTDVKYIVLTDNMIFDGNGHKIKFQFDQQLGIFAVNASSYEHKVEIKNLIIESDVTLDGAFIQSPFHTSSGQGSGIGIGNGTNFHIHHCTHYGLVSQILNNFSASGICGAGCADTGYATINNCKQYGNIEGIYSAGIISIVGNTTNTGTLNIYNCKTYGNITLPANLHDITHEFDGAGGICGLLLTKTIINNCKYNGNIGIASAGIVVTAKFNDFVIKNCKSKGKIYGLYSAGIILTVSYSGNEITKYNLKNCYHYGDIYGDFNAGIIVLSMSNLKIKKCYHKGKIHGSISSGIIIYITSNDIYIPTNIYIKSCKTYGDIIGQTSSGILNINNEINNCTISIHKCEYYGKLKSVYTSGIAGSNCNFIDINNCHHYGDIIGTASAGISGYTSNNMNITDCSSNGDITGIGSAGISCVPFNMTISKCYHNGEINSYLGAGIISSFINDVNSSNINVNLCYHKGNINGYQASGICGSGLQLPTNSITNCASIGDINSRESGGICGAYLTNTTINNCYVVGDVHEYSGGICGSGTDSTVVISNVYVDGKIKSGADAIRALNNANAILTLDSCYGKGYLSLKLIKDSLGNLPSNSWQKTKEYPILDHLHIN